MVDDRITVKLPRECWEAVLKCIEWQPSYGQDVLADVAVSKTLIERALRNG